MLIGDPPVSPPDSFTLKHGIDPALAAAAAATTTTRTTTTAEPTTPVATAAAAAVNGFRTTSTGDDSSNTNSIISNGISQHHQQHHDNSNNNSNHHHSNGSNNIDGILDDLDPEQIAGLGQQRSSSEEKELLTPAQSSKKRKEQNRAAYVFLPFFFFELSLSGAPSLRGCTFICFTRKLTCAFSLYSQRAFRERKERRVRDLEKELDQYKEKFTSLLEHNEQLKREVAKFSTENEILRATSSSSSSLLRRMSSGGERGFSRYYHDDEPMTTGPMSYSPKDYNVRGGSSSSKRFNNNDDSDYNTNSHGRNNVKNDMDTTMTNDIDDLNGDNNAHDNYNNNDDDNKNKINFPAHRITVNEETGERLLNASATWDLIASHFPTEEGVKLDVGDVYERLKGHMRCDGQGPALEEGAVRRAIQESMRGKE